MTKENFDNFEEDWICVLSCGFKRSFCWNLIVSPVPKLFSACEDSYSPVVIVSVCFNAYHAADVLPLRFAILASSGSQPEFLS